MTRIRRSSGAPALTDLSQGPVCTSLATIEFVARDTGILLVLNGAESSFLDLRNPSHLDFEYHQQMDTMLSALRGEGNPLRMFHLGGAGCALTRVRDVTRPGSQQVAAEIDEIFASQVWTWFDLPRSPRLQIRVGDAAEVVVGLRPGQWDVVVRDMFDGGSVPASCRDREFFDSCLKALAPGGLLLVNTTFMPRALAGAEIATLAGALDGDTSRAFIVAGPVAARGRRQGNLVLVARQDPFTEGEFEEAERAVRRLPLPVRTWSFDDATLPCPEGVRARQTRMR